MISEMGPQKVLDSLKQWLHIWTKGQAGLPAQFWPRKSSYREWKARKYAHLGLHRGKTFSKQMCNAQLTWTMRPFFLYTYVNHWKRYHSWSRRRFILYSHRFYIRDPIRTTFKVDYISYLRNSGTSEALVLDLMAAPLEISCAESFLFGLH